MTPKNSGGVLATVYPVAVWIAVAAAFAQYLNMVGSGF